MNENWRWRRWYREIKRTLESGEIGRPRYTRFQIQDNTMLPRQGEAVPALLERQGYLAWVSELILLDWGIHPIDTMRFLFGEIERVYARTDRWSPLVQGEDTAMVVLEFKSGLTGIIDIGWSSHTPSEREWVRGSVDPFVVEGEKGSIELDPYQGNLLLITTDDGTERRATHGGLSLMDAYLESFVNTQGHFARCLQSGEPAVFKVGNPPRTKPEITSKPWPPLSLPTSLRGCDSRWM